jgi:hypothetical protein
LIQDRSTRVIVPIEAIFHSDWSYDKNIIQNEIQPRLIEEEIPNLLLFPCLLIKQSKWEASKQQDSREHSNYKRLMEADDCRIRVIFWEELLHIILDDGGNAYVEDQIARPERGSYFIFKDDWFVSDYRN